MTEEQELGITIASDAVKISGSVTMDVSRIQEELADADWSADLEEAISKISDAEIRKVETTKFSDLQKVAVLGGGLQRANMYALAGATSSEEQVFFGDPHIGQHIQNLKAMQFSGLAKNRGVGFTRKRSSKRKRKNGKSV